MRARGLLLIVSCLFAAGCGGGTAGTPPLTERVSGSQHLVAALGDSITAGSPLWDPDPTVRAGIGTPLDRKSSFEYWAHDALPETVFRNCGVFGERTDEIAARIDLCARDADALIVQGGINDIAQGRPTTEAAIDLEEMVRRGKDLGLDVYLAEVLPWNNGGDQYEAAILDLNREIARIGKKEDVTVLPFHAALEDPADPNLMSRTLTTDGDHPSPTGYLQLAQVLVKALEQPPH